MNTLTILKAARAKIEQGWTQGHSALDAKARVTNPTSTSAVCWCAIGACDAVRPHGSGHVLSALYAVLPSSSKRSMVAFNDAPGRTQAEVLALFDKAIASLEAGAT